MMESAKPIEAGCMAMIVGSTQRPHHNGRIYQVHRKSDDINGWSVWELKRYEYLAYENHLMRIDDPDIQDQLEEESRKSKLDKYKEKVYAKVFFDRPIKTFIHRSDTPGI